jgi:phytoene desaturase
VVIDTKPVVVIGAGIGGLSAAIRLAAAGRRVLIFEQNAAAGGKMGEVSANGFRWDTGPSVITMRPVMEALFRDAGRRLEEYLDLMAVEPLTRYFYPDGVVLDATRDLAEMMRQIEMIEPRDVEGYLRFLAYAARLHRITGPSFLYNEPPTWQSLLHFPPLDLFRIQPWLCMDQVIRRHLHSPHLRQFFGRFATYVGASPFMAPAVLNVIAHIELTNGVWYPRGGVFAIAQALRRLADELGVEIHTNSPVAQILVNGDRASGVRLADGRAVEAAAVIANVDVTTVYHLLLPPAIATTRRRRRLAALPTSCSGYVLLLGVDRVYPQLTHHNIFFSGDYRREFADIFDRGIPPSDPTVYVAITAKRDPSHAPPGCENWFVLVNAPPLSDTFDWVAQEAAYRRIVLDSLATHGFDLRPHLRYTKAITPGELARTSGAWRGALYGLSSNQALNAFRRPPIRDPNLRGLYFAGGTTHPGGGVPMVMLSGKVAAEMIITDVAGGA